MIRRPLVDRRLEALILLEAICLSDSVSFVLDGGLRSLLKSTLGRSTKRLVLLSARRSSSTNELGDLGRKAVIHLRVNANLLCANVKSIAHLSSLFSHFFIFLCHGDGVVTDLTHDVDA